MSEGYRNGAFALGLVTGGGIVLNLFLWSAYQENKTREKVPQTPNNDQYSEIGNWWDWLIRNFVSPSDTLAQWVMAIFTIVAVILVWRTLVATHEMVEDTKRMTRDTREIGQAEVKAYLSIKAAKAFVDDKDGIVFDVTVRNFGQSPAKHVHAIASVWVNREITLPAAMGGETVQSSVEVFSRSVRLGEIPAGESVTSGTYNTHDLSFPPDAVRNAEGIIIAGPGSIGVFAKDVFGGEIFEQESTLVATGVKQFADWERHGNFAARSIFGTFGSASAMRARGWKKYEAQDHHLPFEE